MDTELSGPLFGRFDIQDGKQVMIIDKFFDRTRYSSMGSTEFHFDNNWSLNREVRKYGNNYIGTLHTHPFMSVKPSKTDLYTSEKIHKELHIKQTVFIIVNETDIYLWKENDETIKFRNTKFK